MHFKGSYISKFHCRGNIKEVFSPRNPLYKPDNANVKM